MFFWCSGFRLPRNLGANGGFIVHRAVRSNFSCNATAPHPQALRTYLRPSRYRGQSECCRLKQSAVTLVDGSGPCGAQASESSTSAGEHLGGGDLPSGGRRAERACSVHAADDARLWSRTRSSPVRDVWVSWSEHCPRKAPRSALPVSPAATALTRRHKPAAGDSGRLDAAPGGCQVCPLRDVVPGTPDAARSHRRAMASCLKDSVNAFPQLVVVDDATGAGEFLRGELPSVGGGGQRIGVAVEEPGGLVEGISGFLAAAPQRGADQPPPDRRFSHGSSPSTVLGSRPGGELPPGGPARRR